MGAAADSPFAVAVDAGSVALPTLLKMASVLAAKGQPWDTLAQLPLEVELPARFAFHSVFACPVARDQSSPDNPPLILPCGCVAAAMRPVSAARDVPQASTHARLSSHAVLWLNDRIFSLVLCKQSVQKLARGNGRVFKCPYCPVRSALCCGACVAARLDVFSVGSCCLSTVLLAWKHRLKSQSINASRCTSRKSALRDHMLLFVRFCWTGLRPADV